MPLVLSSQTSAAWAELTPLLTPQIGYVDLINNTITALPVPAGARPGNNYVDVVLTNAGGTTGFVRSNTVVAS